jgi:predicted ATPase
MDLIVKRFKNINTVDLSVDGINLMVGGNNSGKCSVLQAIQFGISVAQTVAMQGGIWNADCLSTSIGQSDLVKVDNLCPPP